MLYGYFVVSGDQEESPICCLCGFVAEADEWERFDVAWRAVLADSSTDFQVWDCFHGTGAFHSWDISRRQALLLNLCEVLSRSGAAPIGTFAVLEHFLHLSSADRAVLAGESIEDLLDLIFYDWTERIICWAHEQSEKISLLFGHESQSATDRYRGLFNKHLSRYLLGPHLTGALAFAKVCDCSQLQAAMLLGEAVVSVEVQRVFPQWKDSSLSLPPALLQMAEPIHRQGRFDAAGLEKLAATLKSFRQKY